MRDESERQNIGHLSPWTHQHICALSPEIILANSKDILLIAKQIPLVEYNLDNILAERSKDRPFLGKWEHSLVSFIHGRVIAILVAYEREPESTPGYTRPSTYINIIATHPDFRGIGEGARLLRTFLSKEKREDFFVIQGHKEIISVQTNSADFNRAVSGWYSHFGFVEVGTKSYPNRTDLVLNLFL
ncbi:MAG TPA: GNAT family N-acetyltransferase [Candidatus Baltobacteraceae bacterium]|nr:GNAT family N-acetyltransferase [Candidatus Baltobacteraceae bacterium]